MKKLSLILVLCLVISLMAGCGGSDTIRTETYNLSCGATITALSGLRETDFEGYTDGLDGTRMAVFLLEEAKPEGYTLADYTYLVEQANAMTESFAEDACGNMAVTYEAESEGENWFYYVTASESPESFWLCQLVCRASDREQYEELFAQWSATLEIPGGEVEQTEPADLSFDGTVRLAEYTLSCGMEVIAEEGLESFAVEGITEYYTNGRIGFAVIQEEKYEGYTLADYADAICQVNGYDAMTVNMYGNYCTEHTYSDGTETYWYYTTVHETENNFYMVQMFCFGDEVEVFRDYFELWSSSFTEAN